MLNSKKRILIYSMLILAAVLLSGVMWYSIINWTFLPYKIDPVFFSIGALRIHWYGLMYVAAFITSYLLVKYRIKTEKWDISVDTLTDFLNWLILGVLLGGRLGYVLIYKPQYYFSHPLEAFLPMQYDNGRWFFGIYGMSYHGGLIGVAMAFLFFCRKNKINIWNLSDLIIPAIPLGYAFGRLGNFINGELYGRATSMPWGMFFPLDETQQMRHPSQLYEMFAEGILLFCFLWFIRNNPLFKGKMVALYLMGYGIARLIVEFFREPDTHLGYILGSVTLGQILCLVMIIAGVFIYKKNKFDKKSNK